MCPSLNKGCGNFVYAADVLGGLVRWLIGQGGVPVFGEVDAVGVENDHCARCDSSISQSTPSPPNVTAPRRFMPGTLPERRRKSALMGQRNKFDAVGCARIGVEIWPASGSLHRKRPMSSSASFGLCMSKGGYASVGRYRQQSRHVPHGRTRQASGLGEHSGFASW